MDLSEARGLVLFRVIRGGIEISQRLGAEHRVYRPLSYSPSNPSVSRTDWPPPEKITGDGSIKGDVKNIFLPPPEARVWFATSSPLSPYRRRSSGVVPLGYSISAGSSSLVATTPISFETNQAVWLYGVNHGSI